MAPSKAPPANSRIHSLGGLRRRRQHWRNRQTGWYKSFHLFTIRFRLDRLLHALLSKDYKNMLWTIFVILLVLWALGMVTAYTMGGLIHLLLLIAVVVLVIRLFQGRRIA
jgi:hypothetical protein